MLIRARAPLRISFGGGGTDVSPYCDERGGAVLNTTINRYAYATLVPGGERLEIRSLDYDVGLSYALEDELVYDGQLDLAKGVLDHFRRLDGLGGGLTVYLHNDAPPGSGLGSSSAICVALIAALCEHVRRPMDSYAMAELAYRIERDEVGIKGGRQDQYAATFGGFNFTEFGDGKAIVNALRLRPNVLLELEYSLVFAYVGGQHFSSHIIDKQIENYRGGGAAVDAMDRLKALAYEMKDALLRGELQAFGSQMHEGWQAKKAMADGITTERIDALYEAVREAGALGGKISGAGGGGFMFFLCEPTRRFGVQEALRAHDAELVTFSFVDEGVQAWSI